MIAGPPWRPQDEPEVSLYIDDLARPAFKIIPCIFREQRPKAALDCLWLRTGSATLPVNSQIKWRIARSTRCPRQDSNLRHPL